MIKSIHSCALFVCFGKFNDFFVLILFGVERKTESKLASNTDTKVSALDIYQFVFYAERSQLPLEKILLRKVHLRCAEKVNKRSNSAQLHCEFQSVALLKATALGFFYCKKPEKIFLNRRVNPAHTQQHPQFYNQRIYTKLLEW